jgi:hypothetical protein
MKSNGTLVGMAFFAMMLFITYPSQAGSFTQPERARPARQTIRPAQPLPGAGTGITTVDEHQGKKGEKGETHDHLLFEYPDYYYWRWSNGYPYHYGFPYSSDYPLSYNSYQAFKRHELRQLANIDMGQVDIHVKPERAEVYVNGKPVGRASHFDGHPAPLWLRPGDYNLAFYENGYRTIERDVHVTPGGQYKVRARMEHGTAVSPERP